MDNYSVKIIIPETTKKNKSGKLTTKKSSNVNLKLLAETLLKCENEVVDEHLGDKPDGTTATIRKNSETLCVITKDKYAKHWNYDGYRFSL